MMLLRRLLLQARLKHRSSRDVPGPRDCPGFAESGQGIRRARLRPATQAGFQREGTLRRAAWANGDFADEVILGLLASEWTVNEPAR